MRIRNAAVRTVALRAAVAGLMALAHPLHAAAQDASAAPADPTAAVNGASPETERILRELRAGKAADPTDPNQATDGQALPDASAPASADQGETAAPPLPADGAPEQQPATPVSQDGLLRDSVPQQPVDGDLAADGKLIAPPDQAADPVAGAGPDLPPGPVANAHVVDGETDARTAAGRVRPITEDDTVTRLPSPAPADDAATADADNLNAPADPPAKLRQAVTDVETDPYAPVGIKRGGFVLLPSLTAETLFSDNVREASSNTHSDVGIVLRPGLLLQSDWSRHSFTFDLRGTTTNWASTPDADKKQLHAAMRGRLDITKLSSLEAEADYDLTTVAASSPTVTPGATGPLPIARTETAGLAYNRTFDRLTLRLHGTVAETVQGGNSGGGGQQYIDETLDGRASYEFSPRLTVFGTAKTLQRDYANDSGIDANGDEVKFGLETDRSAKLSGSFDVGAAALRATSSGGEGASGAVADASLTWLPSALTTVTLAASSNILPTNTPGTAAVRTSIASLEIKHQMRRWLALMGGVSATGDSYAGLGLSDIQRTAHLGFEYDISRHWALLGDLQRTDFASSDATRSFSEDQIRFGVRLQD